MKKLIILLALASLGLRAARADEPADSAPLKRLEIGADDLVQATGLNLYKFEIALPKDSRFGVVLREWRDEGKPPRELHRFSFRKDDDGLCTLRIALLPRERGIRGVLLAQDEDAEYRLDVTGCSPGGMVTNISLPLRDIKQRTLIVHPLRERFEREIAQPGEIRLLTLVASEEGKPAPSPTAFPRAELLIQLEN